MINHQPNQFRKRVRKSILLALVEHYPAQLTRDVLQQNLQIQGVAIDPQQLYEQIILLIKKRMILPCTQPISDAEGITRYTITDTGVDFLESVLPKQKFPLHGSMYDIGS